MKKILLAANKRLAGRVQKPVTLYPTGKKRKK